MDAVAASAEQAGFRMQLNLGEYGGYLSTTFLGDIPPNQIGLAPLIGSPIDPHNIFFSIFHPTSGRHNWGPKGPVPWPGVSTAYVYQPWVRNIRLIRGYGFGAETAVHLWVDKA
jgi:hypothetical protein